jgi:hypothetical protein
VAELALNHVERHALATELDGVGVAQLVRRESAPQARLGGEPPELDADARTRPRPPARRAVDDAEQRPDRELNAGDKPRLQLLPAPGVQPISRRRPPLPWRTSSDPRRGSRSRSPGASASCTRSPRARAR